MINNDIMVCASNYYKDQLLKNKNNNNSIEISYLRKRKLSNKTIKQFGIGISPYSEYFSVDNFLEKNGFTKEEAKEFGIIIKSEFSNSYYDNMNKRITIEIKDYKGNLIAFGGRDTENLNKILIPKYVNTPQTPLFIKKNNLFNLDKAKYYIDYLDMQKNIIPNYLILVEGYFDVMSLWDKGIKNVIAPMGTSLTDEQCKLIRMFTDNVVVCFDGDEPGQKAIEKSIRLLKLNYLNPIPMILPKDMDADDVVQKLGIDYFKKLLEESLKKGKELCHI